MKELSLHILDIVQNSIAAKATKIEIGVAENAQEDELVITINDDGNGMDPEFLEKVIDPYTTSRKTRKVGMGLPLLSDACKSTGGKMNIQSAKGQGTSVKATLGLNHIDRQPIGDIAGVILLLITANPGIQFIYWHIRNGNTFRLDTDELYEALEGVRIEAPEVRKMVKEMICLNLDEL